jgi:hypothetical protein
MHIPTKLISGVALAGMLAACGGSNDALPRPVPPALAASTITVDFAKGIDGWSAGVADYYDESQPSETASGWSPLPGLTPPIPGKALFLTSRNHSDDLLTFVKHQYGGFVAGAKYKLTFSLRYVSDAGAGCEDGRGDNVFMVAAGGTDEPKVVRLDDGKYRLNLDRGNQDTSGPQGVSLGAEGIKGLSCDGGEWTVATRASEQAITVQADKLGKLWVVLGADSAFAAVNSVYLLGATIDIKPL